MATTTRCSSCGAVNLASAIVCVQCGARIGAVPVPEPPKVAAPEAAPQEAAPATPPLPIAEEQWSPPPTPPRRRRPSSGVLLLSGAAVILALVLGLISLRSSRADFPGEIGGYPRMTAPEARRIEDVISKTSISGLHMRGAAYGRGTRPTLLVILLTGGLPGHMSLDSLMTGFQSAAGVDAASEIRASRNGVEYACGRTSNGLGTGCIFSGDVVGAVSFLSPTDPGTALRIAEEAYDGLT